VEEIREKDYDLSMNKYKEVEREVIEYEHPEVIFGRIETLQSQITEVLAEFRTKYM
jgi:type I restriction enzyme M protein